MRTLRWSVRLHRWVALLVGVQILLWIAGGLLMTALPIERVRGEHKIAEQAPPALRPAALLPLHAAIDRAALGPIEGASLGRMLTRPVWRVSTDGKIVTIDAETGDALSPLTEALAREIARRDYAGPADVAAVRYLAEPPAEYLRPGPVWQVRFGDRDATTLYVDPQSGEVRARRSATWRVFDLAWRLHVMDYDDGEDFNHPLVVTAAGAALVVALSGIVLLIHRTRRTIVVARTSRLARKQTGVQR